MYQFGGEENFRGPGTFPGMEQGNTPEINFMTPEGIDYALFLEYLRSQGVSDISEIINGGTPGENDLVIGGPDRDSPLAQIYASIIGRAEGVDPAVLQDEQMRVLNNSGLGAVAEQIAAAGGYENWLAQQEGEVTDINEEPTGLEDEIGVDPDEGEGEESEEGEGFLDRLSNWWEGVLNSVGSGSTVGGSGPPTLPGSSGVILNPGASGMSWPDIISNPGAWQVYLPGVIPGLPQSPTIIGTIEDILSDPGAVLGDLWDQLEGAVANPGQVLEDLLSGVVDDEGLVTIGGISTIVNDIVNDLFSDDDDTNDETLGEDTTTVGGADEEDETLNLDNENRDVDIIVGDPNEVEETIGGVLDSVASSGGGGGGRPTGGNSKDYNYRLQYNPDAPVSVPGGMFTGQPQTRKLRAPELGQPSMVQGLLLGGRQRT